MTSTVTLQCPDNFNIQQIFDCGQCFRFNKHPQKSNTYCGVAYSRYLEVTQENDKLILNTDYDEFERIWRSFFDFDTDYSKIISLFKDDETLYAASRFSSGIRILKQEPWEALCSFIISQNNNIPRIKGIIENMSKAYGEKLICDDGVERYAFPSADALYEAGVDGLLALKTGFRAKYIYDCAKKVVNNEINLDEIYSMSLEQALVALQQISGVGPKVASCALLFGFYKLDAFPIDVWVKKILSKYYSQKPCSHFSSEYAGIAQQYLFYYERCRNNVYL